MEKIWKTEQLEKIAANTSIFKHIPAEIGNVLYCDTNQPETVKLSDKESKKRKAIAISICSIILLLYWSFFYEHYIWGAIITVIALLVTIGVCDTTFSGTDYFVGNKGFATVSFVDSRDNITSSNVYLFKDMEYLFTGETIVKTNYTYSNTQYYFSIFGKEDKETHQFNRIFFAEGSYDDKHPKDPMNPNGANEEYSMMKMVEKVWTTHFVLEHSQDGKVKFGILNEETLYSDALSISRNEVDVYGTIYNPSNTKNIYTSNGNLVIEHINHSKKFFSFIEKGNISSIPLSSLGNRQAFLFFLTGFIEDSMFTLAKRQQLGNYIITFQVKEGDYAETYRVKDADGKNRFLKLINCAKLHRTQFDANGNILEVQIAKTLNHPNVVKYHDNGEVVLDGRKFAYIVFDYISGETASQYIAREGSLSVYDAKTIVLGILNGIKFLHTQQEPIMHNDLTIQNVMLDMSKGTNVPRIIDFGYARYLSQGSSSFNKNGLSPFYLAPEALNGVFSVKSDIFSSGAILYNLIFGIPPYFVDLSDCKNDATAQREKIDAQRELPLHIPDNDKFELDEQIMNIMRKALASDIEERFESADEFIRALNGDIKIARIDNQKKAKSGKTPTKKVSYSVPKGKGFSAIAGMEELKEQMRVEVIDALNSPEEYAKYGLTIPNGMLLYGPPGCGKTFFAKHFAEEVGFNFMLIKPSSLKSRFVNATQENIAQMFKDAEENAPTIIFIDEMNELVPNRDSDVHEMARSAVNEMLAQMDRTGERGVFIIGATNYPDMIDPAILRAGRLDKKYYIGTPDFKARSLMFELYLKSRPYDFGLDYEKLAQLTENYVSADLEMIVNDASRIALRQKSRITMVILEDVISKTKPSLTKSELDKYLRIKAAMAGEQIQQSRRRIGF